MQREQLPPSCIRWRPPHHREPERLIEPQRGFILLVDIDRQRARTKTLRVRHEELASPLPVVIRADEQRFNRVARAAQEADQGPRGGYQHPPIDLVARQFFGDKWAEFYDVAILKKMMRGADGALPQLEHSLAVIDPRGSHVHVHDVNSGVYYLRHTCLHYVNDPICRSLYRRGPLGR